MHGQGRRIAIEHLVRIPKIRSTESIDICSDFWQCLHRAAAFCVGIVIFEMR